MCCKTAVVTTEKLVYNYVNKIVASAEMLVQVVLGFINIFRPNMIYYNNILSMCSPYQSPAVLM